LTIIADVLRSPARYEHARYFVTASMPELLRARATAEPPRVLADLGAGEGAMLYALERAGLVGERIYAVDLSADLIALAEGLSPKVIGVQSDLARIDLFEDSSVDAVTCSQVIEHLPDDRALAAEIARILRPGGWFYLASVLRGRRAWWFRRGHGRWQVDPTHVREYGSEEAFAEALRHPMLELERVQSRPLHFPLADPAVRLASSARLLSAERLSTIYERHRLLALVRDAVKLPVPGYRLAEAVGRRTPQ
jgi:SAM-dependent methyltransferase